MSSLLHDIRFAVRVLLKSPGFTLAAVLVLSAAIGVNTAVFSFVNAFVLRPLPGRDRGGEVVGVYSRDRTRPDSYRDFSYPTYRDIRARNDVFDDVTAFTLGFAGVREGEVTRRTIVSTVTANYFSTLGVGLAIGRPFTPDEEQPGANARVAVLSYDYWRRTGGSPSALGSRVDVNAQAFTVVGVAPRGFTGTAAAIAPVLWVPTGAWEAVAAPTSGTGQDGGSLSDRRNAALMLVGRLHPGLRPDGTGAALRGLAASLEREFPSENRNLELLAAPLSRLTISSAPQSDASSLGYSAVVLVLAASVLLIAGMNLANMVLARGTARQKEVAMRVALGARRGRIVRQLLTEGFLLSLAGGAGGLVLAYWSSRLLWSSLVALSPVPLLFDPRPDGRVLGVTLAFCALSTIVFGLGPALSLARTDVLAQLKAQSGQVASGRRRGRWGGRNLLVAGQFALSLALLTTAGLFVRGAHNASTSDPGYRFDNRAVVSLDAGLGGYDEVRGRAAQQRALERIRALPEVESAAASSSIAFGVIIESQGVRAAGTSRRPVDSVLAAVGSGYFGTLGLPLLRGRDFSGGEELGNSASRVAIVDAPLARRLFGDDDPVGREVEIEGVGPGPWLVVGVAPGLKQSLWDRAPVAHVYVPSGQVYRTATHVHVHFRPGAATPERLQALRLAVRSADEALPLTAVQTLAEHRDTRTTFWAVRMMAKIFSIFGGLALFLAVVGIYSVKAYVVARRTREIGIRVAIGSTPGQVVRMVLGEGLGVNLGGVIAGLLLGLGIARLVSALLYDVSAFDPLVFAATPLVMTLVVGAACYVPARRATRIAPVEALRTE